MKTNKTISAFLETLVISRFTTLPSLQKFEGLLCGTFNQSWRDIPAVPNSDSPWDRGARDHVAMVAMATALAAQSDVCSTLHYFSYEMGDRATIAQTNLGTFVHRLYTEGDAEVLSN